MKKTAQLIKISSLLTLLFALFFCGIYPLLVFGVGHLFFPKQAEGSLLFDKTGKRVIGSSLIGQNFQLPAYFHPRPSHAGKEGYDGAHSSGSNLGPTSSKLIAAVTRAGASYREENHLSPSTPLPIDAITSSASGLDPHISLSNALLQIPRIAKERNVSETILLTLLQAHAESPKWGFLGNERVNVLLLNQKLDALFPSNQARQ
ncbi:MAG TPA: potassium-transporting ATPase subunit C [Parachlamydiales bacterium]|nr:MAG: potassium-transporting ATPase subunit C [Chlamydiae bacterium GWA2_50_15]OGN57411.1 MAG: potassium-transporting ATPase subunit C [Chlamydiae bacterium RIFCSPHIGHO2_02_FULL_49_29]OGN63548.1 MAG: potassium-transporting ATPase subunit C [Chlamydiae bacterium RIFCSPHIGHO2_12_FULL_49_32]OGN68346.1 MAG: potassium-transporting ATPase subunit C [Chlamydiae bacterium RIFCSPLOWO2_02_FULL_49_12]OGN73722.1 MAG: potassium-transporting ATPase subunit C [Chlamydiae bacterium RIFCSPLOWO2_12_FULL_49_12]